MSGCNKGRGKRNYRVSSVKCMRVHDAHDAGYLPGIKRQIKAWRLVHDTLKSSQIWRVRRHCMCVECASTCQGPRFTMCAFILGKIVVETARYSFCYYYYYYYYHFDDDDVVTADCLVGCWLLVWLVVWLLAWLFGWVVCLVAYLIAHLIAHLLDCLFAQLLLLLLLDCLFDCLFGCLFGSCLLGCLVGCLLACLLGLFDCLLGCLNNNLI